MAVETREIVSEPTRQNRKLGRGTGLAYAEKLGISPVNAQIIEQMRERRRNREGTIKDAVLIGFLVMLDRPTKLALINGEIEISQKGVTNLR